MENYYVFLIKAMFFSSILSIMNDLTIGTKYNKLLAHNIHIKTTIKKDNDLAVIKKSCIFIDCDFVAGIYHWSCFQGYLKYLGMAQTATVKRDARMGEAEARMEAGIRVCTN